MTRKFWLFILVILVLLLSSIILMRQPVLNYVTRKVQEKFREKFNAELSIGESGFLGFRDVYLRRVVLVPEGGDTLFTMQSLKARIRLKRLLRMEVRFNEVIIDSATVSLVRYDSTDNFRRFLKKDKSETSDSLRVSRTGYHDLYHKLMGYVEDILSERITMRRFQMSYRRDGEEEFVRVPELFSDGKRFQASIITSSMEGVNLWILNGDVNPDEETYRFDIRRTRGAAFALPFIDRIDGFRMCFDEASLYYNSKGRKPVTASARFSMKNVLMNHWRIAPEDVIVDTVTATLAAGFDQDSVWVEQGSGFELNRLPVKMAGSYVRLPAARIRFLMNFNEVDADRFFDALPPAIFSSLHGLQATGKLSYDLYFDLPRDSVQLLQFSSQLKKSNFRIVRYGKENLSRMNAPFMYLALENDMPYRSFIVGEDNPSFTPLAQISPYLQNAVLTAEDPSFFNHNGFVEQAFRESMITNLEKGRFVRGGSTISMQLVKNVYLSRNKTIARKLEEALIVWLIEQNRLVSKERMFEVYLNIIEWGPGIYGIGEASRFYFNKTPMELNLAESIFLASIIPQPKSFRRAFDASGNLRPHMAGYYRLVAGRMARREKILQSDADSLQPNVQLKGPALYIVVPDTSAEDPYIRQLPGE